MDDSLNKVDDSNAAAASIPLAEEKPSVLADILGLVTHDIRNPLAALSSNVGFLNMVGEGMTEDAREAVADLQLSIEAMGRIIDSMELVCHDLKSHRPSAPTALSVGSVIRSVRGQAERAAESHGVQLEFDCSAHEADRFIAGEVPFLRALSALIHNALTVAPPRSLVRVSVQVSAAGMSFLVEDSGPRLSEELAETALTAAGQVEIKTAPGGRYSRGLGLYPVARSAELASVKLRFLERESGSAIELLAPVSA